ncbi:biotin--[acetyl-CoA-carboxylase] ligase [Polaribacter ponticola]|uniref:Biotin--[acetyl-CoA-carboxylase] ligase n=1 Tax=Polaribacter ponticola TaxID=2978475 RepID=A0ABT5S946_9FLAO|nr:biotin--[acetyl-CoA-carboxylase] ligase [Polaribacter sp. MSW5]MDD7914635.1 biotin--[acetyl-CoA-carboxylase] ligase [Polaribacter sp. MSW5]
MKIIKLNAIDSTNSFLKEMAANSTLENFTVIVTQEQTNGRGQQESTWVSEPHKNLTTSIFTNNLNLETYYQKYLNFAVCLSIFEVLNTKKISNLRIKWPNDIMAENKKICGLLIENTIKGSKINNSIIGIGLNVNQEVFPSYLKNVASLKNLTNINFDLELLLIEIVEKLKEKITILLSKEYGVLETEYLNVLYKKNIPTMFKDSNDVLFMGKIIGISDLGYLEIELEDESIQQFGIKEVSLA